MNNYLIKYLEEYYQVYRKSVGAPEIFLGRNSQRAFYVAKKKG